MVKIRLTRLGRHKQPYYRIVAVDSRVRRDGAYIALLGTYEPFEGKVSINKEETMKWLNNGAQPSQTVLSMLKDEGIWKEFKAAKIAPKKEAKEKPAKKAKK